MLVINVPGAVPGLMCTVRVKTSLLPVGTSEFVQLIAPLVPALGVVQPQDAGFESETNVVAAGKLSCSVAPVMSSGPEVDTVMV